MFNFIKNAKLFSKVLVQNHSLMKHILCHHFCYLFCLFVPTLRSFGSVKFLLINVFLYGYQLWTSSDSYFFKDGKFYPKINSFMLSYNV